MSKDRFLASSLSPSLLLKLGQAYQSMSELDLTLFSIIKGIQVGIQCKNISIWLLDETETELECSHTVGAHAADLLGDIMPAKKFIKAYQMAVSNNKGFDEIPLIKWMGKKTFLFKFDLNQKQMIAAPLVARDQLIGIMIVVNKLGNPAFSHADREMIHTVAVDIAVAIQNTKLYEQHTKMEQRQNLLNHIRQHLHQTLDLDKLIPRVFEDVNKAIHAEAQSIWLVDRSKGIIKCRFATGPESEILIGFAVSLSAKSIVGTSVSRKKSIIIKDAQNDPRRARSADDWTGFVTRSLMTVPLVCEGKSIGAIQAVNKRGGRLFDQEDLDLFRAIADSAALAVSNAQLVADLQLSYDQTLEALSAALDLRDRETEGHSRRVVEYTARLAEQIGLENKSIKDIRRGALIHDIGKIGVPDAILLKPAALDENERKIIERHPQAGYDMLVGISYLQEEIQIVLCHQEKWDGSGYPRGLREEEIPIGARLFAIADTFDALTSDRPYRKGCSYDRAREIIEAESGKQFDPQAVAAFMAIPSEEWEQIREQAMEQIDARHKEKELAAKESDELKSP